MTSPTATVNDSSTSRRWWMAVLVVAVANLVLLRWSWGKWLHPIVDFGRELYVPWQLLSGRALQADLAYFNGPLSPWLNALGFRCFGTSLLTLVCLNAILLAGVVALVVWFLGRFGRPTTAVVGAVFFLVCFAFADPTSSGTYNFLAPYSHEITHGFLLSLIVLALLARYLDRPRTAELVAIAFATGLVFLTKSELSLAITPVVMLATLTTRPAADKGMIRTPGRRLAVLSMAFLLPVLTAFLWLRLSTSNRQALAGVLGSWRFVFSSELHGLPLYRGGMGLLDPVANLRQVALWLAAYVAIFAPPLALARSTPAGSKSTTARILVASLLAGGLTTAILTRLSVLDISRPLPVLLVALAAVWLRGLRHQRLAPATKIDQQFALLVTLFSLLLLLKILLRVRLSHYGFVLAAPATILLIWVLLEGIPQCLEGQTRSGVVFRAAAIAFLTVTMVFHLGLTARSYAAKRYVVGSGADAFLADAGGRIVVETLARLESLMRTGDSLAVLPEGVMLNYLARRPNPTPYYNFMPPELVMFGEQAIVDAFEHEPPDWIVMTGRGATEYGFGYLGRGYGASLADWVRENYALVERIGSDTPPDPTIMSWAMILESKAR